MSALIDMKVITDSFHEALKTMDTVSQKAAQWAIRESARKVKRAAQQRAPVYSGPARKVRVNNGGGYTTVDLVPGEYKKSIASSKNFLSAGRTWRLKVGPRGGHVHLYAGKVEQRSAPMRTGFAAVQPQIQTIYDGAMKRALARYGK